MELPYTNSKDSLTLTWEDSRHTTLFKAVPFTSIPLDTEITDNIQSLDTYPERKEAIMEDPEYFEMVKLGVFNAELATRAGPVLYVKSISICKDQRWDAFQIFGQISITDYQKNIFHLFSCESHRVSSEWSLFFSHCPIAPVMGGKLKFCLRDPKGIFNVDKEFSLDYSCKDDFRDDIHQEFPLGGGYYAKAVFNKIPFAVLVKCELSLSCKPPEPPVCTDGYYKVYGSVTVNNMVCVDRNDSSKACHMAYGKFSGFSKSREVFAVPAGLPLKFDYKLHDEDIEFANGTYEVPPSYLGSLGNSFIEHLPCKDDNYCLTMRVTWMLFEDFFHVENRQVYLNVKWNDKMLASKYYPYYWRSIEVPASSDDGDLVEVFSVFLSGGDSAPHALCGRIVVRDVYEKFYIFARNKDCPDKYSPTKSLSKNKIKVKRQNFRSTLALTWPDRWFVGKDFYMHLRLKDADENTVCKGILRWQYDDTEFDYRFCDVIKGENGCFAAVHYSVFKNAKKAKVTVKCSKKDGYSVVYGRIFAAYDSDDNYPSTYDKECFRSIIFKRSKEDCVTVNNSFEIPLSKSHVSAPSDCEKLIVDADLWVCPYKTSSFQRSTAKMHFKACRSGTQNIQLGSFLVTVNWSQ